MAEAGVADLLGADAVRLQAVAGTKEEAIRLTGLALVEVGAVQEAYIEGMLDRERQVSTYVGEGFAIPHATLAGKSLVRRDALSFLRFPEGVDWDGERVSVCIGIAAAGDGHLAILGQLATILLEPERAEALREATSYAQVAGLLTPEPDDEDDLEVGPAAPGAPGGTEVPVEEGMFS
jgi:PTS system mannitol-specific IIA component